MVKIRYQICGLYAILTHFDSLLLAKFNTMKKYLQALSISFLLVGFILPSCKKDSNTPTPKTKTTLISQSSWKFSSATAGGVDVSGSLQNCQKDNILTFNAGGTGTLDEGPTKCNSGDPQVGAFTWNFQNSETILFVSATIFTGGSSTFNIVSLTETQLVVSFEYTPSSGPTVIVIATFVH